LKLQIEYKGTCTLGAGPFSLICIEVNNAWSYTPNPRCLHSVVASCLSTGRNSAVTVGQQRMNWAFTMGYLWRPRISFVSSIQFVKC